MKYSILLHVVVDTINKLYLYITDFYPLQIVKKKKKDTHQSKTNTFRHPIRYSLRI